MNKNNVKEFRSVVYFKEPELFEHDLSYYMELSSEEVGCEDTHLEWVAACHEDELDLLDDMSKEEAEQKHLADTIDFIKNKITSDFDGYGWGANFPVNVVCWVDNEHLHNNVPWEGYYCWNVLLKTPEDCAKLAHELESGVRSLWERFPN